MSTIYLRTSQVLLSKASSPVRSLGYAKQAGARLCLQDELPVTVSLSETVIDLYRRRAAEWDAARRRSSWNDRVWIDAFAKELPHGSTVLDLGCGGGYLVARFLVEQGLHVTGVDSSPEMIALARDRMPDQEWIPADMRRLALVDPISSSETSTDAAISGAEPGTVNVCELRGRAPPLEARVRGTECKRADVHPTINVLRRCRHRAVCYFQAPGRPDDS
jgi:SAM-dependent methyltransferase